MGGQLAWRVHSPGPAPAGVTRYEDLAIHPADFEKSIRYMTHPPLDSSPFIAQLRAGSGPVAPRSDLKDYFYKMRNFERTYPDDVCLPPSRYPLLLSTFKRLHRVQRIVGFGNFSALGFDEMLKYSRTYSSIGTFTRQELDFLDEQFNVNAQDYGFFGKKVTSRMTAVIPRSKIVKIDGTGQYLYKGESADLYAKLVKAVGPNLILTSGIRGVVKQMHLFLAKSVQARGNLSLASRSLAPPGHSYHGVGDFDVGKVGFGLRNFTADFARTEEYKRLQSLDYVTMRYPRHNLLGVRYEPWHIKVV